MKLNKFTLNLTELSSEELSSITAGESLYYWIFYGVGRVARAADAFMDGARYSYQTMPGLK
ncbi:MAG TPA: hypothetical protein VK666_30910 [Chryseolinea sp.]|nr:hypothetical protein [Chryseolinea sp.]